MTQDTNGAPLLATKTDNDRENSNILTADDAEAYFNALCKSLAQSRNLDDFSKKIHSIIKNLGFTDFLFMRLERLWQPGSRNGLLYSLPEEFMRIYHDENMYDSDLLISYGKSNHQAVFSSAIYDYINDAPFEMELTQHNRSLLQLYKRYQFFEHVAIPVPAFNGHGNVLLILTSVDVQKDEFQSSTLAIMQKCRALCKAIDSVSTQKFKPIFIDQQDSPIAIPRKPLEALRRLACTDTSITALASEMCISPITAHQHIAAARKAFCVKTNIGAVVKAIKAGLIKL